MMYNSDKIPNFLNHPFHFESSEKFHENLEIFAQSTQHLKIGDTGHLATIGLVGWLWEQFKGLLGFENHAKMEYVRFRLLQLVTQAAEKGLLTKNDCEGQDSLVNRIAQKVGLMAIRTTSHRKEIETIFRNVIHHVTNPDQTKSNLNGLIQTYQVKHLNELVSQSILSRIRNSWQKQQEAQDFTQSEFESSDDSETDKKNEQLPHQPSEVTPSQVSAIPAVQKNPPSIDLLKKLADIETLAQELKSSTFSQDSLIHDLYLKLILPDPSTGFNEKLVYEWFSNMLSGLLTGLKKIESLERALKLLDFKQAFALLVAAYRFPFLIKKEEQQLNSSANFSQCLQMETAMGALLEKFIKEHPSEYEMLDLTNLSPTAKVMQFDSSAKNFQFLFELIAQQELPSESKSYWRKNTVLLLGALLGTGTLFAGAFYALKNLRPAPSPPPLAFTDHVKHYLVPVVATVALGIFATYLKYSSKLKRNKETIRLKENSTEEGKLIVSLPISDYGTILRPSTKKDYYIGRLNNKYQLYLRKTSRYDQDSSKERNLNILIEKEAFKNVLITLDSALLIPMTVGDFEIINMTLFDHKNDKYLLIENSKKAFVCPFPKDIDAEELQYALKNVEFTEKHIKIPLKETAKAREERLRKEEEDRIRAEQIAKVQEEERSRKEEENRIRVEKEAKLQEEARLRKEEENRIRVEKEAKLQEEARLRKEEEDRIRVEKEAKLQEEARLRKEAEENRIRVEKEAKLQEEVRLRKANKERAQIQATCVAEKRKERLKKEEAERTHSKRAKREELLRKNAMKLQKPLGLLIEKINSLNSRIDSFSEDTKLKIKGLQDRVKSIQDDLEKSILTNSQLNKIKGNIVQLEQDYHNIMTSITPNTQNIEETHESVPDKTKSKEELRKKYRTRIANLKKGRSAGRSTISKKPVQLPSPNQPIPTESVSSETAQIDLNERIKKILQVDLTLLKQEVKFLNIRCMKEPSQSNKEGLNKVGMITLANLLKNSKENYGLVICQNNKALIYYTEEKELINIIYQEKDAPNNKFSIETLKPTSFIQFLSNKFNHFGEKDNSVKMYFLTEENLKTLQEKIQRYSQLEETENKAKETESNKQKLLKTILQGRRKKASTSILEAKQEIESKQRLLEKANASKPEAEQKAINPLNQSNFFEASDFKIED